MVADAQRVIEQEIATAQQLDRKAEQMMTLGGATVGAALTVALVVAQDASIRGGLVFTLMFSVSLIANLTALFHFVDAYVGVRYHTELFTSPRIEWLVKKRDEPGWNLEKHLGSFLGSYGNYSELNRRRMRKSAKARRRGLWALVCAVVGFSISVGFIFAEVVT